MGRLKHDNPDLDRFDALLHSMDIRVDGPTVNRLIAYQGLIASWNGRVRLVSRSDSDRILSKHIFESLLLLSHLGPDVARLADIGTGGGFPGIPLALARSDTQVSLIESARMKTLFLKKAVGSLSLTNVEVLYDRAERVAETRKGTFDIATSRAVAGLDRVWELAEPLLKSQGVLLSLKGPGEAEADLGPLGIEFKEHHIRTDDRTVAIVVVRK